MANLVKNGNFDKQTLTGNAQSGVPTDWTCLNTPGIASFSVYRRDAVPASITQFAYFTNTTLSQIINFPKSGNYILSYWLAFNSSNNESTITIGSLISNKFLPNTFTISKWNNYQTPFYVSSGNLTQQLSFKVTVLDDWLTGVSIVPVAFDYTLDLYLEWIPDDNYPAFDTYKNKRLIY